MNEFAKTLSCLPFIFVYNPIIRDHAYSENKYVSFGDNLLIRFNLELREKAKISALRLKKWQENVVRF